MLRVLVTRPEPGASRTMRRLEEMGFRPILLPLTETVALPADAEAVPSDATAVAVTSANAVRHASRDLIAALAALPCHAVGKRTAEAARKAGFSSVREGPGDAVALADVVIEGASAETLVYLCGRVRFPSFEQRLSAGGIPIRAIETYDTIAQGYSDSDLVARLSGGAIEAVLLYSAKAAAAMQALIRRPALGDVFEKTRFFVLSGRIAAALDGVAPERVRVAGEPQEDALLALLQTVP
ncbi:uroporphyrinogen-III synthase [Mesorhizobium sp. 131-2-1]|uniref:uroporphyrinogen-III synthase n=1 Tax=Mesorhizobium sp. 131-2-1 TaxID=2744518 RepID=UPI00192697A5|nr:uroporphyrinogen-III synthase [Mesorhizobium sp. 131-2-1]BCG92158.1 uroporphyrinogen III methyltransferase [Mesorhizobium sp. 131-2-1]